MSSFWRFMGGLLVGARAGYVINEEYKKRRKSPPPSVDGQKKETKTEPAKQQEQSDTNMIENLIREYEAKKNRTRQQNDTLDLLRIKLKQLKSK